MANDRLYLRCRCCAAVFYLGKMYPSTGFYTSRDKPEDTLVALAEWIAAHTAKPFTHDVGWSDLGDHPFEVVNEHAGGICPSCGRDITGGDPLAVRPPGVRQHSWPFLSHYLEAEERFLCEPEEASVDSSTVVDREP